MLDDERDLQAQASARKGRARLAQPALRVGGELDSKQVLLLSVRGPPSPPGEAQVRLGVMPGRGRRASAACWCHGWQGMKRARLLPAVPPQRRPLVSVRSRIHGTTCPGLKAFKLGPAAKVPRSPGPGLCTHL